MWLPNPNPNPNPNPDPNQASDRGFDVAIVYDAVGAACKADLYGLTASAIRGIFAAAVRSEAVLAYLASE